MVSYRAEEIMAFHGLKKAADNMNKPKEVRKAAKNILDDKVLFEKFVATKIEKKKAIERKKVLEDKKKNLTGWKKWFKIILPERVILG